MQEFTNALSVSKYASLCCLATNFLSWGTILLGGRIICSINDDILSSLVFILWTLTKVSIVPILLPCVWNRGPGLGPWALQHTTAPPSCPQIPVDHSLSWLSEHHRYHQGALTDTIRVLWQTPSGCSDRLWTPRSRIRCWTRQNDHNHILMEPLLFTNGFCFGSAVVAVVVVVVVV